MTIKRLLALNAVVLIGLGSVFVLPNAPHRPDPGINMALPDYVGDWYEWKGQDAAVTQKERDTLGHETEFARKVYTNTQGDAIFVSIVLAGNDMNTSIHRPERCLPAQGYTMMDSRRMKIDLPSGPLSITRLHNMRPLNIESRPDLMEYSLNYYWFVGSTETTADHIERNFMDIRDRLLRGYNQPWAYVTVVSRISEKLQRNGKNEAQTDAMLDDFLKKLIPVMQKPTVVNR
jgi:EpsI family protein